MNKVFSIEKTSESKVIYLLGIRITIKRKNSTKNEKILKPIVATKNEEPKDEKNKDERPKEEEIMLRSDNIKSTLLNLGCGSHYSKEWTNINFSSNSSDVISYNLNDGIPAHDEIFDVVYHSHVLEHFEKSKAHFFISECFRVLKKNGIIRVAIPDLEKITRLYLEKLEEENEDDYNWMMLEMYDQTVRNYSGGAMKEYFSKKDIKNLDFVISRIGQEGKNIIRSIQNTPPRLGYSI